MDAVSLLRQAFAAHAARCREVSPLTEAICTGLGAGPSPAALDIFSRFFRIISAANADVPLFLAGLHYLALQGDAPNAARFFPSCGGTFRPEEREALVAAVEADLATNREDLLDFLLSHQVQQHDVQRSAAFLLGAAATVDRFGGGLSLVEIGCAGGLNLRFDQYAYRFGERLLGDSPLVLEARLEGAQPPRTMPRVLARRGLDLTPRDLTQPDERRLLESFIYPDQVAQVTRCRQAAVLLTEPLDLRQGAAEEDLPAVLVEAYNAMEPGNTLLVTESLLWPYLSDDQQKRVALIIQRLAAQVQPYKPIAWLQLEPASPGAPALELKLHTFGWADLEDRAVRKLAETSLDGTFIRWME